MHTGDAGKDKGRGKRPFKRRGKTADRTKLVDQQSLLPTAPFRVEDRHAFRDFVASPFGRCLLRRRRGAHPSDGSDQRGRLDHRGGGGRENSRCLPKEKIFPRRVRPENADRAQDLDFKSLNLEKGRASEGKEELPSLLLLKRRSQKYHNETQRLKQGPCRQRHYGNIRPRRKSENRSAAAH